MAAVRRTPHTRCANTGCPQYLEGSVGQQDWLVTLYVTRRKAQKGVSRAHQSSGTAGELALNPNYSPGTAGELARNPNYSPGTAGELARNHNYSPGTAGELARNPN